MHNRYLHVLLFFFFKKRGTVFIFGGGGVFQLAQHFDRWMEGRETSPPKSIKLISDILIFTGCTRCSEAHVDVCTVHVAANHRQTVFFFKKNGVSFRVFHSKGGHVFVLMSTVSFSFQKQNKLPMRLTMRIDWAWLIGQRWKIVARSFVLGRVEERAMSNKRWPEFH